MDRNGLLRMFVLDVIADDYEDLGTIHGEVGRFVTKCRLAANDYATRRENPGCTYNRRDRRMLFLCHRQRAAAPIVRLPGLAVR
jgi:hypothetical protein